MKKLFGTDGMRGEAGRFPLDAQTVYIAGRALARHLAEQTGRAPRIVVGRDTRESGEWIERAFISGASESGAVCESAGIITTPGVAFLTRSLPAEAGVVISASHNPYCDNGIKIFAPSGRKLDDATERRIEADIYRAQDEGETAQAINSREKISAEEFVNSTGRPPAPNFCRRAISIICAKRWPQIYASIISASSWTAPTARPRNSLPISSHVWARR
jgi:phosphomannomutase